MLIRDGNGGRGLLGDFNLPAGTRREMFGPSFRQRLLNPNEAAPTARQIMTRRAFRYKGDGDYGSTGHQIGLFNFGSGAGHFSGNKLTGLGDYGGEAGGNQIMEGSITKPLSVNMPTNDLSGDVYFAHREFVGNVYATATNSTGVAITTPSIFTVSTFPVNAALEATFPWLSQVAANFTMYQLMGCIFEYRPTSGEFSSTGAALGKVIMATQYDPDAPAFPSSVVMENYDYANACKPSERMLHGIETKSSQTATQMLYTRTGTSVKSKVFTDYGNFQIATEGVPITVAANSTATAILGELWVSYKVKLSRAQLFASLVGNNISSDTFVARGGTTALWLGGTSTQSPAPSFNSGNWTIGRTTATNVNLTADVSLSTGLFKITYFRNRSVNTNASTLAFTATANCRLILQPSAIATTGVATTATTLGAESTAVGNQAILVEAYVLIIAPAAARAFVNLDVASGTLDQTYFTKMEVTQVPMSMLDATQTTLLA